MRGVNVSDPRRDRWFAEQILPHEKMLRAWLRGAFPSLGDTDDLVQETYARVCRARDAGTAILNPKAFLFTTARHIAIDLVRHHRTAGEEPLTEIDESSVFADGPNAADLTAKNQELELLTQAIQSLPDRCRQVLTLRKIYGLSQKEIAAELGISEHTVEAQVGIGMHRCADYLSRRGLP